MKLEGVVVCVNYSDFLAWTLPCNKSLFDKLVVVTDTKDKDTKNLCDYHNVLCIQTDVFYENNDVFNKAKGINEGLKYLDKDGWVLHLDSDIYLPPLTRDILNKTDLDPKCIYGVDRLNCTSYNDWIKFIESPELQHEAWIYVHLKSFPLSTRIISYKDKEQYIPIGYFQLWNPNGSEVYKYPETHGAADRTDGLFAKYWIPRNRIFLPSFAVIHLESEKVKMGVNWNGRKTKKFGLNELILDLKKGYHCNLLCRIKKYLCEKFKFSC